MSKIKKKNTTIKILALFIAILLWSYVRKDVNPNIVREIKNINVDIINEQLINDEGLVISQNEDLKVSIKVSGRRSDLDAIKEKEILAEIDLSGAKRGNQKIEIEFKKPFNVEIVDLSKRYINVEIDSLNKVTKDVKLNTIKSSQNDIIESSDISPKTVEVSGPSRLVNQVAKVIVDIDLNNTSLSDKMKLPVKAVDKEGVEIKGIETKPNIVEVTLSLKKEKKVSIKPIIVGSTAEEYKLNSISSNPKTILIIGSESDMKNISAIETEKIDVSGIKEDQSFKVKLILPSGITVEGGKNEVTVTVSVSRKTKPKENTTEAEDTKKIEADKEKDNKEIDNRTITVSNQKISLNGTDEEHIASIVDSAKTIDIVLEGDTKTLKSINESDLSLSLDLAGLQEGTYDLKLIISTVKGTVRDVSPKTIKVKVEKVQKADNIEKIEETQ